MPYLGDDIVCPQDIFDRFYFEGKKISAGDLIRVSFLSGLCGHLITSVTMMGEFICLRSDVPGCVRMWTGAGLRDIYLPMHDENESVPDLNDHYREYAATFKIEKIA